MDMLVREVSAKVKIDKGTARRAVGALLVHAMPWTATDDWSKLVSKLPGAGKALSAAPVSLAVAHGDRATAMEGTINPLRRSGLSSQQIPTVVSLFLDYVRSNAGHSLAERVVAGNAFVDNDCGLEHRRHAAFHN